MKCVEDFKYLGFIVSNDGKLIKGIAERAEAAEKRFSRCSIVTGIFKG